VCAWEIPAFAASAEAARVTAVGDRAGGQAGNRLALRGGARDASLTVAVFCSESDSLPSRAPDLDADGIELHAGGGLLGGGSGPSLTLIYGPTIEQEVSIVRDGSSLGRMAFQRTPVEGCAGQEPVEAVEWHACASIDVLDLHTRVKAAPSDVSVVDGSVDDRAGTQLGFYVFQLRESGDGLVVVLGFQRPPSSDVTVLLRPLDFEGEPLADLRFTVPVRGQARAP
jgi:hypothetical protein